MRADGYNTPLNSDFMKSKIFVDKSKDDKEGYILL